MPSAAGAEQAALMPAALAPRADTTWPQGAVAFRLSQTLLPGAAHSISTITVGYPFDTVKTRLQLGLHHSMRTCVWEMLRKEGLTSFYRGAAMPLCTLVAKRPLEFAVFEWFNARFRGSRFAPVLGGCLAGVTAAAIGCPFSVVKIQMQATRKEVHASVSAAITAVWRSCGMRGFYRGLLASVYKEVPFATAYLGIYGTLREALPKAYWSAAVAGGSASIMTWTLLQPLDTLKTVIQAKVLQVAEPDLRWTDEARRIAFTRGYLGLWAGWGPVALRSLPTSATAMVAYEWARTL
mmetsp:Transcript_138147/g.240292  ORF Transcript_138147/g.240292 Transcript_138147/m.240292 type:complete len:294 (-) Transcript_138147:85-966(-)